MSFSEGNILLSGLFLKSLAVMFSFFLCYFHEGLSVVAKFKCSSHAASISLFLLLLSSPGCAVCQECREGCDTNHKKGQLHCTECRRGRGKKVFHITCFFFLFASIMKKALT